MAFGKVLKVGSAVLAAAGGVAGATEVITTVVEQHNYEYQHVINETHTYWINGVEYTEEEWNNYLTNVSGSSKTLYYGAVDSYEDFTLADLESKSIVSATSVYNVTIAADLQYTVFAIPEVFEIASCQANGYTIDVAELTTMNGYTVYSQPDEYEVWLQVYGEFTYTLTLK